MGIPVNATVQCDDGLSGRSTHIVVNPITEEVTHCGQGKNVVYLRLNKLRIRSLPHVRVQRKWT